MARTSEGVGKKTSPERRRLILTELRASGRLPEERVVAAAKKEGLSVEAVMNPDGEFLGIERYIRHLRELLQDSRVRTRVQKDIEGLQKRIRSLTTEVKRRAKAGMDVSHLEVWKEKIRVDYKDLQKEYRKAELADERAWKPVQSWSANEEERTAAVRQGVQSVVGQEVRPDEDARPYAERLGSGLEYILTLGDSRQTEKQAETVEKREELGASAEITRAALSEAREYAGVQVLPGVLDYVSPALLTRVERSELARMLSAEQDNVQTPDTVLEARGEAMRAIESASTSPEKRTQAFQRTYEILGVYEKRIQEAGRAYNEEIAALLTRAMTEGRSQRSQRITPEQLAFLQHPTEIVRTDFDARTLLDATPNEKDLPSFFLEAVPKHEEEVTRAITRILEADPQFFGYAQREDDLAKELFARKKARELAKDAGMLRAVFTKEAVGKVALVPLKEERGWRLALLDAHDQTEIPMSEWETYLKTPPRG